MILTSAMLLDRYKNYANPYGKIQRLVQAKKLIPLAKGLYEDNPHASGLYLSNAIYGPSYISFNTALAYYGLIPEVVYDFTSATTEKRKNKSFTNYFGTFTYRDIPLDAYPYGIVSKTENGYTYLIATPEKALCDKLYALPPVSNQKQLEELLFDSMRIDHVEFAKLNRCDIYFVAPKYHSTNLKLLTAYLRRKNHE